MEIPECAQQLKQRYEALKALRTPFESLWNEVGEYVLPRRDPTMNGTISLSKDARLFDTTAGQACMTLANGQLAWMSPQETPWFSFTAPAGSSDDELTRWLSKATDRVREELATSNFYTSVHELYLDRSGFGTGCLFVEPGKKKLFNCQYWPVGSFVIDEDDEGNVDTVIRCFKLTPRQAAQKFGEEKISAKLSEKLKAGGAAAQEKFEFLHFIMPREDAKRDKVRDAKGMETGMYKVDGPNMPIASIYMESDGCHTCRVSGYEEMPVMVTRYLEWGSGMGNLYGWSPAYMALPDARQLNHIQKMLDALAEKMAFPPTLAPDDMEGEIDPNAGGVTYFSKDLANANLLPREWMTQGRYDVGKDRVLQKQESINKAFHVDLFQMFAQLNKQMTAREVAERSSEKLIQFSPTFARLVTELFNPLLDRLFNIALRAGVFGGAAEIPQTAIARVAGGMAEIATPRVQYSSRIALAMRALPTLALHRSLELMGSMAQIQVTEAPVTDNLDWDKSWRETAMNDGVPADFLPTEQTMQESRAARAEAAAQQQQQEQAMMAADAAAKVGGIPPESPVAAALADAA